MPGLGNVKLVQLDCAVAGQNRAGHFLGKRNHGILLNLPSFSLQPEANGIDGSGRKMANSELDAKLPERTRRLPVDALEGPRELKNALVLRHGRDFFHEQPGVEEEGGGKRHAAAEQKPVGSLLVKLPEEPRPVRTRSSLVL